MQLLAMITMLIDHVGLFYFPDQMAWRVLGRLAFVLYAFLIVQGYYYTRSVKSYLKRLFMIGLFAQIPYTLAFQNQNINVVGTLFICLLVLWIIDVKNIWFSLGIVGMFTLLLDMLPFEYGSYALLLILIFRYAKKGFIVPLHFALNGLYLVYMGWMIQLFSVLATIFIIYCPNIYQLADKIKIKRWVWRSFYPAHLAVLAIINLYTKIG